MADHRDQEALVSEFCAMSGANPEQATQYLEAHGWDITAASNSYFQDEDELTTERQAHAQPGDAAAGESYTGPRTLDGRPAPQAASSSTQARMPAAKPKKTGVATLSSLSGGSRHHVDDEDDGDDFEDEDEDDGRGNLFAGGEKSGLAVQDPKQDGGGAKKIISDILAKAKANAQRPEPPSDAGPSHRNHFRGTGVTLGGDGIESRSIPDPLGVVRQTNQEPQERVLHLWQDGFSIDDGELRRFDDPANQMDLQLIRSGRAPLHLMNVEPDQPVDVKLNQHETPYVRPPKKFKPFSGAGQRLGSPVPGAGTGAVAAAPPPAAAPATATSTTSGSATPAADPSRPTVMIRIQLPDGSRLPARFNTTQTVEDVYEFVRSTSVETQTRPWVLATTFPNKDHTDKASVLGDMPEFRKGGTAMVKWV